MTRTVRATALLTAVIFTLNTLGVPGAFAQSQTDVKVLDLDQIQSSQDSTQTLDIGNASGGGSSTVTINKVTQTQGGQGNTQRLNVGNAKGGSTNVHIGTITQTQTGNSGTQKLNIGNVGEVEDEDTSGREKDTIPLPNPMPLPEERKKDNWEYTQGYPSPEERRKDNWEYTSGYPLPDPPPPYLLLSAICSHVKAIILFILVFRNSIRIRIHQNTSGKMAHCMIIHNLGQMF
ncbi:MAG: hypothetical protein FWF12_08075 [Betaproteobacteria bacterium]|nr:hypothetical protein [Betaproteobacteria bacterium]